MNTMDSRCHDVVRDISMLENKMYLLKHAFAILCYCMPVKMTILTLKIDVFSSFFLKIGLCVLL